MFVPQIFILKAMGILSLQDHRHHDRCRSVLQILLLVIAAASFVSQVGHVLVLIEVVVLGMAHTNPDGSAKNRFMMWLLEMAPGIVAMLRSMAVLVIFQMKRSAWYELCKVTEELEGSNLEKNGIQQVGKLHIYTCIQLCIKMSEIVHPYLID